MICRRGRVACTACQPSTLLVQPPTCPLTAPSPPASSSSFTSWVDSGMLTVSDILPPFFACALHVLPLGTGTSSPLLLPVCVPVSTVRDNYCYPTLLAQLTLLYLVVTVQTLPPANVPENLVGTICYLPVFFLGIFMIPCCSSSMLRFLAILCST